MKTFSRLFVASTAFASLCLGVETRVWSQGDYSDFEKGNLNKLSLLSDGRLMLAPAFRELFDSSSAYLWALAEDSKGNVYAGGGGPGGPGARLYLIPPRGKGSTLAEFDDLEIHALAVDKGDQVYAATSPDGKVYKVAAGGKSQVFYDPQAKYIWAMVFDNGGNLYIATGDRGEIHRVTPQGKGEVFFKTGETHARSLAIDDSGNLIVGTEPGGLITRISPKAEGFVLYQADRREITAVAIARDGTIYAAGVGRKQATPAPSPAPAPAPSSPKPLAPAPAPQAPAAAAVRPVTLGPAPVSTVAPSVSGGSEVYRITPDGFPRRVWSHAQDIAYAIGFDSGGRALIGTGNKGTIYRLESDHVYSDLINAPPTQVTCLFSSRGGKLFAATGNIGKVYQIGPDLEREGTIDSEVFDAGTFSYWGRLSFRGKADGGQIAIKGRSGNLDRPQKDWSPWSAAITAPEGGRVAAPAARFLQWRATLKVSPEGRSPELEAVDVAYLARNVAPALSQIETTPANYRFPAQTLSAGFSQTLALPPLGRRPTPAASPLSLASASTMQYAKGHIGARWNASDENGDALIYTVEIRGEKESEWKPLKSELNEKHLSWDSTRFADGEYRIRVIASDAPGNPPAGALTAEIVSAPFLIDNTPPRITGLAAAPGGAKLNVRWKAVDALSVIEKAEYSLNGGDWTLIESTTRLSDSRELDYVLALDREGRTELTIAVRVTDEYQNQAVEKTVARQ
jgi:sugar lactone lactonase YvrE